ncbi:SDR family oxidoreductase [Pseudomonas sp. N040]|uniref:SDR family oxidoreductase n=1 Tax=Pseudomonas sp. N040 TaxID=2785325 RepID=UPI0018A261B2|nr:SDR family oxidoreductase [Pseudomonas sp. N040]MBF7731156.1 SDR family oxidoreductase [Pseudomonas sp. N040]MBW7014799.1 SDR family oxidoreductase [Pseudomonas sp. N040]
MRENCFVTGGTGYIGQHLVALLTSRGHPVTVLMRKPDTLPELQALIDRHGGNARLLSAVAGDLSKPDLGLSAEALRRMQQAKVVFSLGANFAWGLSLDEARAVTVNGAVAVAQLAAGHGSRLLMLGGFMLENHAHLQRVGVDLSVPARTDWPAVYRRVGGYEGSKLEAHFKVLACMQALGGELTIVHPATVCGHSQTGHILPAQPLAELIRNLASGKLSAIPGSPEHWLPVVPVDFLVELMVAAAFDPEQAGKQVLALDARTPNLPGMLELLAGSLGVRAPTRCMPIGVLRWLLKIPGLPTLLNTSPESLDFIQTTRFDTAASKTLALKHRLEWPDLQASLQATARYVASA